MNSKNDKSLFEEDNYHAFGYYWIGIVIGSRWFYCVSWFSHLFINKKVRAVASLE
ncbi:hypothetical protein [Sporosarcina sp. NPDC096371]|uniref:hypothetical protein n=1 Tax=Sporosarcina sp. NPDC096371 TaxID=3364530 RepID=UPI00380EFC1C